MDQVGVLQAEDAFPYKKWETAAAQLKAAAQKGDDISAAVPALIHVFNESSQINVMIPACDAIVLHCLNRNDMQTLQGLVERKRGFFPQYILKSLSAQEKIPASALPLLIDGLSVDTCTAAAALKNIQVPFEKIVDQIRRSKSARQHLPDFLRELQGSVDITPAMPLLAELLSENRGATSLIWIAEAGGDFTPIVEELMKGKISEEIAYALSYFFARTKNADERLTRHADAAIRRVAIRGLGVYLANRAPDRIDLTDRIALALLDENAQVRSMALSILKAGFCASQSVLRKLIDRLDEGIGEYLCSLVAQHKDRLLSVLQSSDHPIARRLQEMCRGDADPGCEICLTLPRYKVYSYQSDVPPEFEKLSKSGSHHQCPKCGTLYKYEYESEYEDMSFSETITIERLSPTRTFKLDKDEKKYNVAIAALEKQLTHPVQRLREDAAWALAIHYLDRRDWEPMKRLLTSADSTVRHTALRELPPAKLEPFENELRRLLPDPMASRLLATLYVKKGGVEKLLDEADTAQVLFAIFEAIRDSGFDPTPLLDRVASYTSHPVEAVRNHASWALEAAEQKGFRRADPIGALVNALQAADLEVRKNAAEQRYDAAQNGKDIAKAVPELIKHLADPAMLWPVVKALECASELGKAIPHLLAAYPRDDNKTGIILKLSAALKEGHDVSSAIPMLIVALDDANADVRNHAVGLLGQLSEKEIDISGAIAPLLAIAQEPPSYYSEHAAETAAEYYTNAGRWDEIKKMLGHSNKHVRVATLMLLERRNKDLGPVLAEVAANLSFPDTSVQFNAKEALKRYAKRGPKELADVEKLSPQLNHGDKDFDSRRP